MTWQRIKIWEHKLNERPGAPAFKTSGFVSSKVTLEKSRFYIKKTISLINCVKQVSLDISFAIKTRTDFRLGRWNRWRATDPQMFCHPVRRSSISFKSGTMSLCPEQKVSSSIRVVLKCEGRVSGWSVWQKGRWMNKLKIIDNRVHYLMHILFALVS